MRNCDQFMIAPHRLLHRSHRRSCQSPEQLQRVIGKDGAAFFAVRSALVSTSWSQWQRCFPKRSVAIKVPR
jgi:hypothetical protein